MSSVEEDIFSRFTELVQKEKEDSINKKVAQYVAYYSATNIRDLEQLIEEYETSPHIFRIRRDWSYLRAVELIIEGKYVSDAVKQEFAERVGIQEITQEEMARRQAAQEERRRQAAAETAKQQAEAEARRRQEQLSGLINEVMKHIIMYEKVSTDYRQWLIKTNGCSNYDYFGGKEYGTKCMTHMEILLKEIKKGMEAYPELNDPVAYEMMELWGPIRLNKIIGDSASLYFDDITHFYKSLPEASRAKHTSQSEKRLEQLLKEERDKERELVRCMGDAELAMNIECYLGEVKKQKELLDKEGIHLKALPQFYNQMVDKLAKLEMKLQDCEDEWRARTQKR